MNIICLSKQFGILAKKESAIKFLFEPQMAKQNPSWKRHIYFNELKYDFMCEISAYGFSPYIHQTFDSQRQNKRIMKYQSQKFNYNLIDYIRKQNEKKQIPHIPNNKQENNIKIVHKMHSSEDRKTSSKSSRIKPSSNKTGLNSSAILPQQDFLLTALRKISTLPMPKNKKAFYSVNKSIKTNEGLNTTFFAKDNEAALNEKKVIEQKQTRLHYKRIDSLKERYSKSLREVRNIHPAIMSVDINNMHNKKEDFTLLRKYNPDFDNTANPVGLIKNQLDPISFARREREKELKAKNNQRVSTFKKLQPSIDNSNRHKNKKSAKSANHLNNQSDLLHRTRKSTEIIFCYA